MPPHTTLQYTMPSNTTNSKPTLTTSSSNGTTQLTSTSKPLTTSTPAPRQRRATSASSYVLAPSWFINNKIGSSVTEGKSTKEEAKGVSSLKKDELGVVKQVKDGNSSLNSFTLTSVNGSAQLTSTRTKSRDFSGSRLKTLEETDGNEEVSKTFHGRSRSVSQANSIISSSPTSFDRNFPTLAKKKQFSLSVDSQTRSSDNMWANSDTKSKLLSPTSIQVSDDMTNDSLDDEPELERRMSLVPKVEIGKLDGKRAIKHSVKRKTSRSLSMDSAARSPTINSGFGFGVGIGISSGRANGQSQHFRPYLRETMAAKSINIQPQRPRAMSISASNGAKKSSMATAALPRGTGQTLISRKLSVGSNSKYTWMGKMGNFKMTSSDDDELSNERKENVNQIDCDHINEEEEEQEDESIGIDDNAQKEKDNFNSDRSTADTSESCNVEELSTEQVCDIGSTESSQSDHLEDSLSQSPASASLEREENFLRQLGWQKPYDKDDDSQWAITEEEKRFFINLVRALNGVTINEKNGVDIENTLSNGEINRANKNWAACIQSGDNKTSVEYLRLLI